MTGVTNFGGDLTAKRLALLTEAVPRARRVAVMFHPDEPVTAIQQRDAVPAAKALGVELHFVPVRDNADLPKGFDALLGWKADALLRFAGQANFVGRRTAELALKHRVPAMLLTARDVEDGGLISYWTDHAEHYRRAAAYVDRILRGTKPAELPVERPTKLELVVNVRTARLLGIAIPQSVLVRADRVIE